MRPKKVLFLITKANWGGAQRYVYDLATNLPRESFEPVVAFGEPGKLSEGLARAGIRTIPIPDLGRDVSFDADVKSFFQIWALIRKEMPDLVHLNSSKAAALGAIAARLSGVPRIIFTVHGWPFKETRGLLASDAIRAISWLTAFLSHAVIVVSKDDERVGRLMRGLGKKIRYVPLGIATPEFLPRDMASMILPASIRDWPRLVTIAELTANKGIGYALEAILLLKALKTNVSYFIIGEGEERGRLVAKAQEMEIADRVHFLGFVPDAARYLKAFDMFILPSIKEGMPYVLLEAGVAQLATISTAVVDPMFFQLSPEAAAVKPADPQGLADAILKMLHPKDATARPFVSDLPGMIDQTMALYRAS